MSIVDLLNTNGCFDFISEWITTRNSKRLLWMVAFITYVLSANLDNLTTALMMFAIVRQLLPGSRFRMYYGAVVCWDKLDADQESLRNKCKALARKVKVY